MKDKEIIPEQCEQPKTLPAPSNEEGKDQLAGWQKVIVALAEARPSVDDERDVVFNMHRRGIGLCRVVEDLALNASESDISLSALARVMEVVEEDILVAKWLTSGRPLYSRWE